MDESDQSLDLIRRNRALLTWAEQTRLCCHEALATARELRGMAEAVRRRAVQVSGQSAAVRGLPNIGTPVVCTRYLQALRAETAADRTRPALGYDCADRGAACRPRHD